MDDEVERIEIFEVFTMRNKGNQCIDINKIGPYLVGGRGGMDSEDL